MITPRIACCLIACLASCVGCTLFPDIKRKPQYHNPFPQIQRVAVLPFSNQSKDPTLSGSRVSLAYYSELQSIPGFEVLPTGVVESKLDEFIMVERSRDPQFQMSTGEHFQRFAQFLGVDAVLTGSIADYESYYPPRMTLKVNWYAANPGFHPVPPGYGLPWGTKEEKKIPEWVRLESERALAAEQLKTQTPDPVNEPRPLAATDASNQVARASHDSATGTVTIANTSHANIASQAPLTIEEQLLQLDGARLPAPLKVDDPVVETELPKLDIVQPQEATPLPRSMLAQPAEPVGTGLAIPNTPIAQNGLPSDWPDPQGFVPAAPSATRPPLVMQSSPIMSHVKAYNGSDEDFTEALSEYYYFRDDSRFGGHQSYLQRSEDFIRFCCHQHIVETLALRGGQRESRIILRWPLDRYAR